MTDQINEKKSTSTLIGTDNYKVALIFDESGMKISRDSRGALGPLIISVLFLMASAVMLIVNLKDTKNMVFLVSSFLLLFSLFFIVYAFLDFLKVLRINRRTFYLSEIKSVKAKIKKKTVHLSFQFNDNTSDKISIEKSEQFDLFSDLLKKNYIVMDEIN